MIETILVSVMALAWVPAVVLGALATWPRVNTSAGVDRCLSVLQATSLDQAQVHSPSKQR